MGKKRGWDHTRRKELAVRDASESSDEDEGEREEEHQMEAAALASFVPARAARAPGAVQSRWAAPAARGHIGRPLDWVENLDCCEQPLEVEDVDDDQREVAFYNIAKAAVHTCSAKLKDAGVPYKRPEDYFAEMVKSDRHMARVKDQLIFEQRKMAAFEMRKSQQQHKKRAKQVQAEKIKARHQEKQNTLDAVKKWRKTAADRRGLMDDEDGFEQVLHAKPERARTSKRDLPQKGKKRQAKDAKFGFGGKKRFAKRNNADSHSKDGFNLGSMRAGKDIGERKKGKKGARPGKRRRAQMRSKSRSCTFRGASVQL